LLPTAYAYMYRYLARLSLTAGNAQQARHFLDRAWATDRSIFYRDPRSMLTLVSVRLSPLSKQVIGRSLGSVEYTQK
ncbi:MAG TPA: glycosyltransferase family 2 protein, partial [Phormidium sp.]